MSGQYFYELPYNPEEKEEIDYSRKTFISRYNYP